MIRDQCDYNGHFWKITLVMITTWFGKRAFWKKSIKIIQETKFGPRTVAVGMGQNGVIKELLLRKR